jgi:hypothetical protein
MQGLLAEDAFIQLSLGISLSIILYVPTRVNILAQLCRVTCVKQHGGLLRSSSI